MTNIDPRDPVLMSRMANDEEVRTLASQLLVRSCHYRYSYNVSWLGRPIIQYPEDLLALQEIVWNARPDLIIETGIAHGGGLIFYASLLEMLGGSGEVLGIDIDIRSHNRAAIEAHPMFKRITMIEGSSVAASVIEEVERRALDRQVLVVLDSNHTHDHVLQELRLYSAFVQPGSYLIALDTCVEDMPDGMYPTRPWGKGDNPKTAVYEFLAENDRFAIDRDMQNKLLLTAAPDGYLKCVKAS